ncbi:hypothetical protein [Larkinella humicola]|uniref:Uncharacterized protein n=1 Tax=Larkinella humicola TaxID=2607654 RepID=A0A5N1J1T1_9BACT|nr:hypothetical protein [Larkinella humicola]KAA9340384.1 hypothetical protein F0P93_31060 [Larkinella humicola]
MRHPSPSTAHYVFITDENGIDVVFNPLKSRLLENNTFHVSLLYLSDSNVFVFQRELDALSRHFPSQFLIYYEIKNRRFDAFMPQETIEVVLNSNTRDELYFSVAGSEEFVASVIDQLRFLGINETEITADFFKIN